MRRLRNRSEYPAADSPEVTVEDGSDALARATAMVAHARSLVDAGEIAPWQGQQ
jgi:hypothetical protein